MIWLSVIGFTNAVIGVAEFPKYWAIPHLLIGGFLLGLAAQKRADGGL